MNNRRLLFCLVIFQGYSAMKWISAKQFTAHRMKGFSLLEIVVAVGILAVVSAIIFPALIQFLNINERLEKKNEQIADLQRLFVFMENDFRYLVSKKIRDPIDGLSFSQGFTLDTDDDELAKFVTLYPDAAVNQSVNQLVAWQLNDEKLQRKTWFSTNNYADEEPRVSTIINDVAQVELRVAGEEDDNSLNWQSDWDEEEALPRAIEVVVSFVSGDEYRRVFEAVDPIDFAKIDATNATNAAAGNAASGNNAGAENGSGAAGGAGTVVEPEGFESVQPQPISGDLPPPPPPPNPTNPSRGQ